MLTPRRFPIWRAILGNWKTLAVMALYSSALCATHVVLGWDWLAIPTLPVTVLGTAVSFYLGFKGNSAYDRLWEARKIWGGIVNTSRTWAIHVVGMVTADEATQDNSEAALSQIHRVLIYRQIAWLASLRTQLRRPKSWEHNKPINNRLRKKRGTDDQSPAMLESRIAPFLDKEEVSWLMARKNQSTQLLATQSQMLRDLRRSNHIDDFRHMELAKVLETLFTLQGKCERIKNFPLPRQYATANHWFVLLFVTMIPLALVGQFDQAADLKIWWTIPTSMLLGWVFVFWDTVVDYSENPFEGLFTDIPMDALSRTIEIDLRDILEEQDLPQPIGASDDGVMM